jgi:hypothetical protein
VTITGNKATNNGGVWGIRALGDSGLLSGNVANGNTNDGLVFSGSPFKGVTSGLTVSNNRAAFNGQYGIEGRAGDAIDGGGNVVQDNGTAAQCANIICHEVSN